MADCSGRLDDYRRRVEEARPVRRAEVCLDAARVKKRRNEDVVGRVDAEVPREGRERVRLVGVGRGRDGREAALLAAAHVLDHALEEGSVAEEPPHLELRGDVRRVVSDPRVALHLRPREAHPIGDALGRHHGAAERTRPELDVPRRALHDAPELNAHALSVRGERKRLAERPVVECDFRTLGVANEKEHPASSRELPPHVLKRYAVGRHPSDRERILARVEASRRLRRVDVLDSKQLERLEERLAALREAVRAVVREALLDEHVAVEAREARDRGDAKRAERVRVDVEEASLGDVGDELRVAVGLEAEHRRLAGLDLTLHRAAGDDGLAAALEPAVHDELVLHAAVLEARAAGVAAVEAHVEVALLRAAELDALGQDVVGNGVVDVEERRRLLGSALDHVLGHGAVEVDFARDGDSAPGEAGVDVARDEVEARLERGPALVREDGVLGRAALLLVPVHERKLELRELREEVRIRALLAELLLHVLHDRVDLALAGRHLVEVLEEVELGVLLHVDAEVEERLDRCVAREEVVGPRAEAEHLEVLHSDHDARDRGEVAELGDRLLRVDDGILGDVDSEAAQADVVAEVEDAAERVAAVGREDGLVLLLRGEDHRGAAELLDEHRRRAFGAEVAEEHAAGVDAFLADPLEGLKGVDLVLDRDRAVDDVELGLLGLRHHGGDAFLGERRGEAVAADANKGELHFGLVYHGFCLSM